MKSQEYMLIAEAIQDAFSQAFEEHTRSGVAMCAEIIARRLEGTPRFDSELFLSRALTSRAHN